MVPARPIRLIRRIRPISDTYTRCVHPEEHSRYWCEVIARHTPIDEREMRSVTEFLRVVPTLAHPFDEESGLLHVTASAVVMNEGGDKVVLHLHKRLNMWLQPGGHVEPGETVFGAALREAHEETGLPVRHATPGGEFFHVDVHPGPRGHTHFDLRMLLVSPEHQPSPADGESPHVSWFPWDDALGLADEGLVGALVAARARMSNG